jgi:hypothetical protein
MVIIKNGRLLSIASILASLLEIQLQALMV